MAVTREEKMWEAMLNDAPEKIPTAVTRKERMLQKLAKQACDNDTFSGGGGSGGVSSWNDLTDNPFGETTEERVGIVSYQDAELDSANTIDGNGQYYTKTFEGDGFGPFVVGEKYCVGFCDENYTVIATEHPLVPGMVVLGSYKEYCENGTGEYPFGLAYRDIGMHYLEIVSDSQNISFDVDVYKKVLNEPIYYRNLPEPIIFEINLQDEITCNKSAREVLQALRGGFTNVILKEYAGETHNVSSFKFDQYSGTNSKFWFLKDNEGNLERLGISMSENAITFC